MASSRTEIRIGQVATVAGITKFHCVGGRVPAGKRWNLNLIVNNSTGGALTFSAGIVNRYPDYGDHAETAFALAGSYAANTNQLYNCGAVHPNEGLAAYATTTAGSIACARITVPSVIVGTQVVATGLGNILDVRFSPDGNWLAVAGDTSPYLKVYAFSEVYGIGLAVSAPASLPNGAVNALAWHPAGTFIACNYSGSAVVSAWPWAPGFGTKLSDSSSGGGTAGCVRALSFRPQGDAIIMGMTATPFIKAWPFTGTFGTAYSNPGTLPDARASSITWAPGGGAYGYMQGALTGALNPGPWIQLWSAGHSGTRFVLNSGGTAGGAGVVFGITRLWAVSDYAFLGYWANDSPTSSWVGGEWNPLGVAGRLFTSWSSGSSGGVSAQNSGQWGSAQGDGILIFGSSPTIKSVVQPPANSGGIGLLANAMTIAANSTAKISGHVMNEGERLIVASSGVLNVMASAVEITL